MRDLINQTARRIPTWSIYVVGALPCIWIVYRLNAGSAGPDPVRALEAQLGLWALKFLIASLAVTPLRWAGINFLKFRRAIGLMAFFYISLHLTTWVALDLGFRWSQILGDLYKRPYIIVGMIGFLAALPLAITSNNASIRKLGAETWRRLHKLAYVVGIAGTVHFVMIGKVWKAESLTYLAIVALLLAARAIRAARQRAQTA
jgi:methionine sulfoxide reductase heme-binding subunit